MSVTPKTEYQLLFYFMQGREGRAQRRPHHSIFYPDLPARFTFSQFDWLVRIIADS